MLALWCLQAASARFDKSDYCGIPCTTGHPISMHSSTMNTYAGNGLPVGGGPTMASTSTDYRHMLAVHRNVGAGDCIHYKK